MSDAIQVYNVKSRTTKKRMYFSLCLIVFFTFLYFSVTSQAALIYIARNMIPDISVLPDDYTKYTNNVTRVGDLHYPSKYGSSDFDIYYPSQSTSKASLPVIIWVHGGAFISGDKRNVESIVSMLASAGYVVIAMNYQLAPEARYPTPVLQVYELLNYLPSLAQAYPQIDDKRVFLAGDSAGAQISAQSVLAMNNATMRRELNITQSIPENIIRGVLLFCGPYSVEKTLAIDSPLIKQAFDTIGSAYLGKELWRQSKELEQFDIITNVTSKFPPTFIADGNYMSFSDQGKALADTLKNKNVPVQTTFFNGSRAIPHQYQVDFSRPEAWFTFFKAKGFLQQYSE